MITSTTQLRRRLAALPLILVPLMGTLFTATIAQAQPPADIRVVSPQNEMVVQGTGEVTVTPDTARLDFSVTTDAPDSAQAVEQNATSTTAVLKAIRATGIPDKDLCTVGFNLNPRNDYDNGKTIFRGYTATNTVRVIVRRIADAGKVIDAATKSGANGIGGIQFQLNDADQKKATEQAMSGAVEDAARKALVLARAAKLQGLRIVSLSENGDSSGPRPFVNYMAAPARAGAATPVQAGEQTISVSVTIRYTYNTPAAIQ